MQSNPFNSFVCLMKAHQQEYFVYIQNYRLLEDAYVIHDPFSPNSGHLTLGGQCRLCSKDICVSQVWAYPYKLDYTMYKN